ncbi:MAG: MFS transporter, partial [Candidatus Eremiobacteraeota bacterium]|nr:MFS transporter [Candidatus Eremiobacteraeota bacterium]
MKLPRALLPLYLTTLLDVLGFTLMIPLLPAFVKHYGAANIVVGALLSLPAVFSMISAPLWGATSDRAGRKAIILISQAFSLAGYLLLALANSLWLIFASRVIIGFGAGNMGVAQSYVADVTNPQQRERAYALFGALYGAGFLIGPILGAQLLHFGLSAPFYFAAAVELVAIGLTWVFLNAGREKVPHSEVRLGEALRNAGLPGVMRTYARQFLFIFSVTYFLGSFALYLDHAL